MIIKVIKGGKSSKVVDYVLKNSKANNKILLSGNGDLTSQIINNSNFKENYYHITLAENGTKGITTDHWKVVLDIFKKEFFVGYDEKEFNLLGVLHDNEHIHLVLPKLNLVSGTNLQLYLDGIDRERLNLIRDLINNIDWTTHGLQKIKFSDPGEKIDFQNDKTRLDEILEFRTKYDKSLKGLNETNLTNNKDKKEFIKTIQKTIHELKKDGFLNSPKEVLQFLGQNLNIKKSGFDTKFVSKSNQNGLFISCEMNDKTIRIPIKELNNEQFKQNNKDKSNESISNKSGKYEEIRSALDKENTKRISRIEKRKGKIQKVKTFEFNYNDNNNYNNSIRDRLENDSFKPMDTISIGNANKPRKPLCGVEFGQLQKIEGDRMKSIRTTIKELRINDKSGNQIDFSDQLEFEPNLKSKKFNDITKINIAQQEQINLKDRVPFIKKNINMKEYLENEGVNMVSNGYNNYLCRSPLRNDKNPSFGVFFDNNKEIWMFHDFATKESGTIIDLHMELKNSDINDTISELMEMTKNTFSNNVLVKAKSNHENKFIPAATPKTKEETINPTIIEKDIFDYRLKNYLKDRGIYKYPKALIELNKNQFQNGKINKYTYIALKNKSGGYVLRNKNFKGNHGQTDLTEIDNKKDSTIIVEGMFDFLSLYQRNGDNSNYISLNSITNINNLELKKDQKYILALDNDSSGKSANLKIIEKFKDFDINVITPKNKDFNEDLIKDPNIKYNIEKSFDYVSKHNQETKTKTKEFSMRTR